MSVIIRLQNLPWSANALDIRQFFRGLSIPEGGVHIVGGELGDAFIAFSTDEDARQAFQMNNGKIKEVQVKLLLSSRTEMQKVIEAARTAPFMQSVLPPQPAMIPQAPMINSVQTTPEIKKEDKDKSKDDSKRRSRDRDRERSRRRSRSRTRSRDRRDRSKDRRDRRRRDRSRSRDRRRDRRRRSRSRERTRSRDKDSRRSRDKKEQEKPNNNVEVKDETSNNSSNNRVWEKNDTPEQKPPPPQAGLLGNFPSPTSLEDARRSLGLITGLQTPPITNTNNPPLNNMNNRMLPRNDLNNQNQPPNPNQNQNRDNNWQRKTRFENTELGMNMNQFNQGNMGNIPMRPNINQNQNIMMPNMFNQNMRMPMQPMQENFGLNRPFLQRPGTSFPDQFKQEPRYHFDVNNEDNFRERKDRNLDRNSVDACVQLRPYFGGYGEIRKFFHGLFISNTGVKFHTENGKRTGIVYIKFVYPNGKEQAIHRSGMVLRGVPVEVTHLDDEIWEKCGTEEYQINDDNSNRDEEIIESPNNQHFTCVVVDDLPEFAKEHDILKLFSDYTIVCVHMIVNKQYRQQAYVQFSKEEDAQNAVADKKSHVIGGKPVTVCPISDDTFNEIVRQQGNGEMVIDVNYKKDSPNNFQPPMHIITDCVMMSGLPQKISDRDIRDFFSDIGVIPVKIHIMMNKFIPNGDCFCEFNSPDDAINALDKNNMPLGMNTIHVELCHRREMERALSMSSAHNQMNAGPRFPNRFGPRGPPNPNMMGGPRHPNMMRRRPPLNPGMRFDGPADNIGPQGCVVSMENVPFKAGVDEILVFFENFELVNEDVFRRYNDNGAPTGDARVKFKSPAEAHRAVEECNKHKIRDRTIFLHVL